MSPWKEIDFMQRARFRILLASLALLLVALPVTPYLGEATRVLLAVLYCLIFASATFAVSEGPRTATVMRSLFAIAVGIQLFHVFGEPGFVLWLSRVCTVLFLLALVFLILRHVYKETRVNSETICAALTAYLLLGFIWANTYSLIDRIDPSAFDFPVSAEGGVLRTFSSETLLDELYFSFVTLTTLGYGEITPLSPTASMLVISEAIAGQFFLAVLIARLIGLQIAHKTSPRDDETPLGP